MPVMLYSTHNRIMFCEWSVDPPRFVCCVLLVLCCLLVDRFRSVEFMVALLPGGSRQPNSLSSQWTRYAFAFKERPKKKKHQTHRTNNAHFGSRCFQNKMRSCLIGLSYSLLFFFFVTIVKRMQTIIFHIVYSTHLSQTMNGLNFDHHRLSHASDQIALLLNSIIYIYNVFGF